MPASPRRSVRSLRLLAAGMAVLATSLLAGSPTLAAKPAGETPRMHIEVNLSQREFCGLPGYDAPGTDARVVVQRDGVVLQDLTVPVFPDGGFFEATWPCGPGDQGRFQVGDRIVATSGDQRTALVLRDLQPTFNLANDVIHGRVRPGRIEVTVLDCVIALDCQGDRIFRFPRIGDDGRWSVDTDQFDLRGGDAVALDWTAPNGNHLFQLVAAPHITVSNGSPKVTGHARPGALVHATLESDGRPVATGSGRADARGRFALALRSGGATVAVSTGDIVRSDVFPGASIRVLADQLSLDAQTGHLAARCTKGAQYLYRLAPNASSYYAGGGHADRLGRILETFTVIEDDLPLAPTATIRLWCANPLGNSQLFRANPS